jgi:D-beta-D-heptose 7-phosphate kinase / D-beta-D-heptose 1-phosphate adenosyltransferase
MKNKMNAQNLEKIPEIFSQFRNKRILIIGDAIIDHYIYGVTSKISPDAPVPLLDVIREEHTAGSFIKVIQNIINFGGKVELVSCIGNDIEGEHYLKSIKKFNIGLNGVFEIGKNTPKITRIVSQGQQMLRIEKKYDFDRDLIKSLNKKIEKFIEESVKRCDAILILDYNIGLLNPILISQILAIAQKHEKKIICRPEDQKYYHYKKTCLVVMNRNIASIATGVNSINETSRRIIGTKILNELNSQGVFIPWIDGDSYLFQDEDVQIYPSLLKHPARSYSNVGSTTMAIICLLVTVNVPLSFIMDCANYAGCLAATKEKNSYITLKELEKVIKSGKISAE